MQDGLFFQLMFGTRTCPTTAVLTVGTKTSVASIDS